MGKIEGLTDVIIILDRSGSMTSIKRSVVDGYKGYIKELKAFPGECRVTLWQFDTEGTDCIFDKVPLPVVSDRLTLEPRGGTPLFDAIGKVMGNFKTDAEKVIFMIITDGHENSSREYTRDDVKKLIEKQNAKKGRHVAFMAANIDAFATGRSYGIAVISTRQWDTSYGGTQTMFRANAAATNSIRGGASAVYDVSDTEPENTSVTP